VKIRDYFSKPNGSASSNIWETLLYVISENALAANKIQWVNPRTGKVDMNVGFCCCRWKSLLDTTLVKLRDQES
jgi:phosphate-selective porin